MYQTSQIIHDNEIETEKSYEALIDVRCKINSMIS